MYNNNDNNNSHNHNHNDSDNIYSIYIENKIINQLSSNLYKN